MAYPSWDLVPEEWRDDQVVQALARRDSALLPLHIRLGAAHRPGIACVVQVLARSLGALLVVAAFLVALWPLDPSLVDSAHGDVWYGLMARLGRLMMVVGLMLPGLVLMTPRMWWWGGRPRPCSGPGRDVGR